MNKKKEAFDNMELGILAIYESNTKEDTLDYIREAMEFVDSSDQELLDLMEQAAEKLEQISEEEFQKLNLRSYRWEDEEYEV